MKKSHIAAILLTLIGIAALTAALVIVYSSYPIKDQLDLNILQYFYENRSTALGKFFFYITNIGHQFAYIGILLVAYYVWDKKRAFRVMATLFTSTVTMSIFKYSFNLPRPDGSYWFEGVSESSPALPSGHTLLSTSFWGTATAIIKRWWFFATSITIALLIGFSRIFLSVHWFTDVLAGLGIGLIIIALYIELEEPITNIIEKLKIQYKMLLCIPLFLVFALPIVFLVPESITIGTEIHYLRLDQLKLITLFTTVTLSYVVEGHLIEFNSKADKWWKYILRIFIGAALFAAFYFGLSVLFGLIIDAVAWQGIMTTLDLIRYATLGPVIILLAPWIITKLEPWITKKLKR